MSAPVVAFPAFHDLKKKVAHEGGFSDGGVLCISETLTPSGIDLAPRKGTAVSGFSLPSGDVPLADVNPSALVMNFDPVNSVEVQVLVVFEDGSSAPLQSVVVPPNTPPGAGVMPLPLFGVILTNPNKLRLKTATVTSFQPPTQRVLLKACMVEFDKPADLDAA